MRVGVLRTLLRNRATAHGHRPSQPTASSPTGFRTGVIGQQQAAVVWAQPNEQAPCPQQILNTFGVHDGMALACQIIVGNAPKMGCRTAGGGKDLQSASQLIFYA